MLQALFVSAVLYQFGIENFLNPIGHTIGIDGSQIAIVVAFVVGLYPNLAIDVLVARVPAIRARRVSEDSKRLQEDVPLDAIAGIDPFMKLRLEEFEIYDVQNLATLNPIQIFVETLYGLYEVIDWVAQARLILAVGPGVAAQLKSLQIRTIFDLKFAIYNNSLREILLSILTHNQIKAHSAPTSRSAVDSVFDPSTVTQGNSAVTLDASSDLDSVIRFIRDDLHVQRLRQVWDVISSRLEQRALINPSGPDQSRAAEAALIGGTPSIVAPAHASSAPVTAPAG